MPAVRHSIFSSLVFFSVTACADSPISLMQAGITSAYKPASKPLPPEKCNVSARMVQAGLRHIEGKGIGYNQGYTTLELLIRPESGGYSIFPFFDLRGHIFDDGKFASNVGVGFRARTSSRIWGLNTYYDYRRTHKYRYNQVGAGFETLGRTWDFRLNGYIPVGTHESRWYELKFDKFKGHSLFLKRKQEFAMRGVDGEIGAHLRSGRNPDLYVAAGPYYFENKDEHALGAKGRLGAKWRDYFSLELSGSYDNLFHGIVQGEIGFYIPLGPKSEAKQKGSCSNFKIVMDRMIREPVVRDEIIIIDKRRESLVARDPATGDPYVFWFVNNQSHSNGTFESPFPLLSTAIGVSKPGDIIYIFPGDRTSTGLDAMGGTFQLKNNQQLWGAGVAQFIETQFGNVKVPALASGLPLLTGVNTIITVANNNKISGLHLLVNDNFPLGIGIGLASGSSVNNLTVTNNHFDVPVSAQGIVSNLIGSTITISHNLFNSSGLAGGAAINLQPIGLNSSVLIINNSIFSNGNVSFSPIRLIPTDGHLNALVSANTIVAATDAGFGFAAIDIEGNGSAAISATIQNNTISNSLTGIFLDYSGESIILFNTLTDCPSDIEMTGFTVPSKINIQNNTFVNSTMEGINIQVPDGVQTIANIQSNTFINTSGAFAVEFLVAGLGQACLRFQNNQADNIYFFPNFNVLNLEPFLSNTPNTFVPFFNSVNNVPQGFCGN